MNAPEIIDYVFGQLEGPARELAELEIARDPKLSLTVDRLGRAVHRLVDDGDPIDPPTDLARRTLLYVAENRRKRSILDFVPVSVPFRWADIGVAAAIFLASLLTLVPALRKSKDRMDQAGCGFNLQQLAHGLLQYADRHGHFPYAPPGHKDAASGTFVAMLHDANLLHDLTMLDCPCNGKCKRIEALPHLDRLSEISKKSPQQYRDMICWDYAYHAGYRQESGEVSPIPAPSRLAAVVALVADQPPHSGGLILEGNSPNHKGRGQNVLFTDGHLSWNESRRVSPDDPDLFLNASRRPGPGIDIHDAALVPSVFPFNGR